MPTATRFQISFDAWYRVLSTALLLRLVDSYVDVTDDEVAVRMGWAFRTSFPRSSIASTARLDTTPLSRGVHGFAGRWLVNGSGDDILTITLNSVKHARVLGFPVRLRQLMVSVENPEGLVERLRRP